MTIGLSLQACTNKINRTIRKDFNHEKSAKIISAFYSGTQNQGVIYFLENNKFYLHSTGVFFYDEWFTGDWKKDSDTLNLSYKTGVEKSSIGTKLILKSDYIFVEKKMNDTLRYQRMFRIMKPEIGKTIKFDDF